MPIGKELGWLSLFDQRKIQKLCLCKQILLGGSPIPPTCFKHHQLVHLRYTNSKPLCRKAVRTHYCKQSFFCEHCASVEWHPRGNSGSGSSRSFQKATQTFHLTLFVYFILLCVAVICVCVPFFPSLPSV